MSTQQSAEQKDLIVGTHGRSFYRADLELLQAIDPASPDLLVLAPNSVRFSSRWGSERWWPRIKVEPSVTLPVYSPLGGKATLMVKLKDGPEVQSYQVDVKKGAGSLAYDLTLAEQHAEALETALNKDRDESKRPIRVKAADNGLFYLRPGKYEISLTLAGKTEMVELEVK